jgi:predicted enzyme related to lactoylglutathione lyase
VPYVEVRGIKEVTDRARSLGATVLLEPRECADGWCSVVTSVQGGEIALWQPRPAIDRPPPPAGNDGTHR